MRGTPHLRRPAPAASSRAVIVLGLSVLITTAATGCGTSAPSATASTSSTAATSTVAPTTAPTTTVAPTTTTTAYQPSAPQSSGPGAASALVAAWAATNAAQAATVAAPAAVQTLFAQPYPRGELQFRGCGQQDPLVCTYRNLTTEGIYEIDVVATASGGWYVNAVTAET